MSNFFNPDFYPTPEHLTEKMILGHTIRKKVVLEPHGGSGMMIDLLRQYEPDQILACELNEELAVITKDKSDRFLCYDFLDVKQEDISHVDFIIANPPFSTGAEQILHMFKIAPPGCVILSLINYSNYEFKNSDKKRLLAARIQDHGSIENWGNCFSDADRKTDVEVGFITLTKPGAKDQTNYDEYFSLEEEYRGPNNDGVTGYNSMKAIVSHVVSSLELFQETVTATAKMEKMMGPIGGRISFGAFNHGDRGSMDRIDFAEFKKLIQKSAWTHVFSKMNMNKYVTQSVKDKLNTFVEQQTKYPFTMNNISKMIEMVIATQKERMDGIIVEAFDQICSFSSKNSTAGQKWKTNSDYKINKKFIRGSMCDYDSRWPKDYVSLTTYSYSNMDDIMKALCYLTGKNYDHYLSLENHLKSEYRLKIDDKYGDYHSLTNDWRYANTMLEKAKKDHPSSKIEIEHQSRVPWGEWSEWQPFFKVKGHKSGSMHFVFLEDKVWEMFNVRVSELKGWQLPKSTDRKTKGTEHTKEKFPDVYDSSNWV